MKTDFDFTYIFIAYISVTLRRQAKAFYERQTRVFSHESLEYIDSKEINEALHFQYGNKQVSPEELAEMDFRKKEIYSSLSLLREEERYILREKHVNQQSDASIGKRLHISGQMVSRKKRQAYAKLRKILQL
jgi:RNA polymerase sigma factor (sigma-70 family)